MFFRIINFYTTRFPFPARGLKYFLRLLRWLKLDHKKFLKKIPEGFFMKVSPAEHMQQQLFWYGCYDKPLGSLLQKLLTTRSIVIDVGANIGYYSLLASRICKEGMVYALEPVPHLFDELTQNIQLNQATNIRSFQLAAGEEEKQGVIYLSSEDNQGMSSMAIPENYSGNTTDINVVSLDTWQELKELPSIDLIKIDVEGYEIPVLKGMQGLITLHQPVILIEINPETLAYFGQNAGQVMELITESGYQTYIITPGRLIRAGRGFSISNQVNALLLPAQKADNILAGIS